MNYSIYVTAAAKQDLLEAAEYIAYTLLNPDAAEKLVDKAEKAYHSLDQFPQRNALVNDVLLASCGIRFIVVNNYLAFYVISEDNATVHIIRFLYGKRNWARILKQDYLLD